MIAAVSVVIPARNEEAEIAGCLRSVLAAAAHLTGARPDLRVRVVVVLDDCRDATAAIVARTPGVDVLAGVLGCVGGARRAGAQHALTGLTGLTAQNRAGAGSATVPAEAHWLASTDADCRVPIDWLTRMVAHADTGADLVLGTVRPRPGLSPAARRAWLAAHRSDDGHPHVHGANLGIRASTYSRIGGWSSLTHGEDVDLVRRAEAAAGVRVQRSGDLMVRTSARLVGRAPHGFAAYLRDLVAEAPPA
ncbi:glycosyltransferase [uncultured Jatrophihabitans sp.]|uniref:glycosyltransferase n=1 Tax=uncultured Jatrophihabitans sp. TaxID=1610747 RepID=UPI0035CB17BB